MAKKQPKRALTEQDKINFSKGKKFTKDYQPEPEKISEGKIKANAEKKELEKTVDILTRILQKLVTDKQGTELTAKEAMLLSLLQKALKGDIRAIELIIKILGEMPAEKHEIKDVTPEIKVASEEDKQALEKLKNADFNKGIS